MELRLTQGMQTWKFFIYYKLKIIQQDNLPWDITFLQKIQKESQKQEKQIKISNNWYP